MRIGIGTGVGFGSRVFSPASLAGLFAAPSVALARATGKLFQDSGKTTPATADAHPVRVAVCPFTAVEFTAPSDAGRPTLNGSGGTWWLTFDGSDDRLEFSGPAANPLSVHGAVRLAAGGSTYVLVSGPSGSFKFKLNDAGTLVRGGKAEVSNWTAANTGPPAVGSDAVLGINYGSTGSAVYWRGGASDGTAIANVATDLPTVALSRLGANAAGSERFAGRMYGWAVYSAKLADADVTRLHSYLAGLFP